MSESDATLIVEFPPEAPDDLVESIRDAIATLVYDWPRTGWDPFIHGLNSGARKRRAATTNAH